MTCVSCFVSSVVDGMKIRVEQENIDGEGDENYGVQGDEVPRHGKIVSCSGTRWISLARSTHGLRRETE